MRTAMLQRFRFAAALLLIAAAAGCSSSSPTPGPKLTWRTLSRGLSSGVNQPARLVIRDETSYLKLWADHAAEMRRVALPPAVDFTKEMVVLVALGSRPTGGYLVEVVDAELRGRTVRLLVLEHNPSPGILQIQIPTQPYQFIALPAMNARVEFRTVQENRAASTSRKSRPGTESSSSSASAPESGPRTAPVTPVQSPRGAASAPEPSATKPAARP